MHFVPRVIYFRIRVTRSMFYAIALIIKLRFKSYTSKIGLAEAKRILIKTLRYKRAINHILGSSFIIVKLFKH